MFKTKKSRTILVLLALVLTLSVTVFAKQATETISVMYDNIKILIDGVEYTAKDANGNVIEPFIYNGTTYLPVRGIANAFDKNVDWEPQTSTVILGSKNYDWLDQMGYANYETSGNENTLTAWDKDNPTVDGIKYDRGIKFKLGYGGYGTNGAKENNDGTLSSYQNVEYLLNNNYKSFKGKIVCEYGGNTQSAIIKIYGDGTLLYTSPPLSIGAKTVDFDIDISDYKILKINADMPNLNRDYNYSLIGIVDARLEKK
mgnify:CR=1 FL=1